MAIAFPDVAVSRDGRRAIRVLGVDSGFSKLENVSAYQIRATVQLEPYADTSWLRGRITDFERVADQFPNQTGPRLRLEDGIDAVMMLGIGEFLDSEPIPEAREDGRFVAEFSCYAAAKTAAERKSAPKDIHRYIASKIYWASQFEIGLVEFTIADARRLNVDLDAVLRVADGGNGELWLRIDNPLRRFYQATPKLWESFEGGRIPGIGLSPLFQITNLLSAPAHKHARLLYTKANAALQRGDLENAVKDAVAALESIALITAGRQSGTMGEAIKDLRRKGELPPPIDKAFEAIWGYSSEQPGVRHGGTDSRELEDRMATFVMNMAASAICFLIGGSLHE